MSSGVKSAAVRRCNATEQACAGSDWRMASKRSAKSGVPSRITPARSGLIMSFRANTLRRMRSVSRWASSMTKVGPSIPACSPRKAPPLEDRFARTADARAWAASFPLTASPTWGRTAPKARAALVSDLRILLQERSLPGVRYTEAATFGFLRRNSAADRDLPNPGGPVSAKAPFTSCAFSNMPMRRPEIARATQSSANCFFGTHQGASGSIRSTVFISCSISSARRPRRWPVSRESCCSSWFFAAGSMRSKRARVSGRQSSASIRSNGMLPVRISSPMSHDPSSWASRARRRPAA